MVAKRPRSSAKARRTAARLAAVQILYDVALTGRSAAEAVAEFVQYRLGHEVDGDVFVSADATMLTAVARGADAERTELGRLIDGVLKPPLEWGRIEVILQSILLAAAWELLRNLETPVRIIIADYVDIARGFYGGTEPGLVNGLLDRLARDLRPYEFGVTGEGPIPVGPIGTGDAG